jgi:hypothetical protein
MCQKLILFPPYSGLYPLGAWVSRLLHGEGREDRHVVEDAFAALNQR